MLVLTSHLISETALIVYKAGTIDPICKPQNQGMKKFGHFLKVPQYSSVQDGKNIEDLCLIGQQ